MKLGVATKYIGRAMPIVIVTLPTATWKLPKIALILLGAIAKLHNYVVGLLSIAAKLPTLFLQILGLLTE
jgi:hypothetical protein